MGNDITFVTAYFDIGRGEMKKFERSTDVYFDYFKKWAYFKNRIIIFVQDEDIKNAILEFRRDIGLEECTTIIVIDDILKIAPDSYELIQKAIKNTVALKYRLRPNNPDSNSALYNYVMMLKAWCINYSAESLHVKGHLAWIDFGFNHGGTVYDLRSNFNVVWNYDFSDKITIFNLKPMDERPIFDIVFSMDTYIMGSVIVVPSHLAATFWEMAQYCTRILAEVGISDDDQVLWLMSARKYPELFDVKPVSGWHRALKEYGCNDLILVEHKTELKYKEKLRLIKRKFETLNYCKRIYSVASKWTQQ